MALIFAAKHTARIRSLALTDCDVHDNWPPAAFKPFLALSAAGGLRGALETMLADKASYRSAQALGPAYEQPERVDDATIEHYPAPPSRERPAHARPRALPRRVRLRAHASDRAPAEGTGGADAGRMGQRTTSTSTSAWSHWLADVLPCVRRRVEFDGARLFFPEERWQDFNRELLAHWQASAR